MIPDRDSTFINYIINGISLLVMDRPKSRSGSWIADELAVDDYGIDKIEFHPGDVIIDIGAHVGMFSIYLAKKFPFLSILAFEPEPINFNNLLTNLALNRVNNVIPRRIAITKDARSFSLISPLHNSGGSGGFLSSHVTGLRSVAVSETLDDIFEANRLQKCKLLKMDCEGAEHEILANTNTLDKIERLSVEIHINDNLRRQGYSLDGLLSILLKAIPAERLAVRFNEFQ